MEPIKKWYSPKKFDRSGSPTNRLVAQWFRSIRQTTNCTGIQRQHLVCGYSHRDNHQIYWRWIDQQDRLEIELWGIYANSNYRCSRFPGFSSLRSLLAEGNQVIGMDNFVTGSPENLAHLAGNTNFTFIEHDVADFILFRIKSITCSILPRRPPNPGSPYGYPNLPIQTMKAGA